MKTFHLFLLILTLTAFTSCTEQEHTASVEVDSNGVAILTDAEIKNLVNRSYQYVAMYNVNNKFAAQQGWNNLVADTRLKDHTMRDIARPNNDTYYVTALLDLRSDPILLTMPAFGSKYSSLMVTAYDHYVNMPRTTREGDFEKEETILFYSDNTVGYDVEPVEGVDEIFKTSGDFVSAVIRVMPHRNDPAKHEMVVSKIQDIRIQSLAEFNGGEPKELAPVDFPQFGKTDADVFENNLAEVMQFVFNHTSYDPNFKLDQEVLAAWKPLGIEPGKEFDPATAIKLDGDKFRKAAEETASYYLKLLSSGKLSGVETLQFLPKGSTDELEALLSVSVVGPIGLPMKEVIYQPVVPNGGGGLNAMHDYVITMAADELPPAGAFWSLTLYDKANGFFIPNDQNKYSVGENAGMKLNNNGGIDIYISPIRPADVPEENWLPITRGDLDLDIILRIYEPDLKAIEDWTPPVAALISA